MMTSVIYLPGAAIGYLLLQRGTFDSVNIGTSPRIASLTDSAFGWAADAIKSVSPGWTLFPVGVILLVLGFNAIDRLLPSLEGTSFDDREVGWSSRVWPMFLAGCAVTLVTLSVSVSLTLLVPLVAKGHIRRSNTLPYIAGANITTLADTLVAAILIGDQDAVRVVLAVTVVVTILTLIVLLTIYPWLRRTLLGAARFVLASNRRLAAFTAVLFLVPLALIAF